MRFNLNSPLVRELLAKAKAAATMAEAAAFTRKALNASETVNHA